MNSKQLLTTGAFLSLLATAKADFTNGSFEAGNFVPNGDDTMVLNTGATDMTGWTVVNQQLAWIGPSNPFSGLTASDGDYFLDLTSYNSGGRGGVQQSIATVPGDTYQVSFDLGSSVTYGGSSAIDVFADGVNVGTASHTTADALTWTPSSANFVATGASTLISLIGSDGQNFIGLDHVSAVLISDGAAPTPDGGATAGLLLLGLGAIAWRKRQ